MSIFGNDQFSAASFVWPSQPAQPRTHRNEQVWQWQAEAAWTQGDPEMLVAHEAEQESRISQQPA